eukprot:g19502.t1
MNLPEVISPACLGALLFGDFLPGPCLNEFFYHPEPVTSRHQLRRDFPEKGDCCYGIFQNHHGVGQEILKICRSEGVRDRFRSIIVFSTPKDQWAHWASPFFSLLTSKAKTAIEQFLNRPGVRAMRSVDTNFYYLEQFLEKLGFRVQTFPNLDGRSLVSYQCVMLRGQWEDAKDVFQPVFNLHRAAYRHANGGTAAPSLRLGQITGERLRAWEIEGVLRVVVRKTFLELDEESIGSQLRRTKSEPSWSQAEGQDFVLTCMTPPCEKAMYLEGVAPNSSVDCFGFVTVQMTFNGRNMFGNLTYEYVKMPQVTYASPFPASGWSNDLTIALFGVKFQEPMWSKDKYLPPERVHATLLSPETLRCHPTMPAAASGINTEDKLQPLGVNLEVSMSTQVDSASEQTVLAEERMELQASIEGNFPGDETNEFK